MERRRPSRPEVREAGPHDVRGPGPCQVRKVGQVRLQGNEGEGPGQPGRAYRVRLFGHVFDCFFTQGGGGDPTFYSALTEEERIESFELAIETTSKLKAKQKKSIRFLTFFLNRNYLCI